MTAMIRGAINVVMCGLCLYFGYHTLYGPRGYYAWQEKKHLATQLTHQKTEILLQRETLQARVRWMRDLVDPDLLEQYAWQIFQMTSSHKRVLLCR